MSLCGSHASRTLTWLPEKVTLHHFTHAAQLLTYKLSVRNALNELCEEDAEKRTKEKSQKSNCDNLNAIHISHLVMIVKED